MPLLLQHSNTINTSIVSPYSTTKYVKTGFSSPRSITRSGVQKRLPCKLQPLKGCGELAANDNFLHRFHVAATVIQSRLRGNIGRRAARTAKKLQKTHRSTLRVMAKRATAATKLQAMTRGFMLRSRFAFQKLELQLVRIEKSKQRELNEIQARKTEQLRHIKTNFEKKRSALRMFATKQQSDFEMAKKIIAYLRAENKKLRERNEALRNAIENMIAENKLLSKESNNVSLVCGKLSSGMTHVNDQNGFLQALAQQMERQIEAFQEAIALRDEAVMTEYRMGRSYFNCIQSMVLTIDETSDDSDLMDAVDETYAKMHNGRGLEETERDLTENFS